jgi:hypothetical protein
MHDENWPGSPAAGHGLKPSGCFAQWQPVYAEYGISTFPVHIVDGNKKPAVRNYLRTSPRASRDYAAKFATASALGFVVGPVSKITVLDIDTPDERVLFDALERHGNSPIIIKSGSGHFQVWYQHAGEGRHIRPRSDQPIDVLGAGFVVAPPSVGFVGAYQFISGSLDDLSDLPTITGLDLKSGATTLRQAREGQRNKNLFDHCMRQAHHCDDLNALLDVARTHNDRANSPPLPDDEVVRVANSAWDYTVHAANRYGQRLALGHQLAKSTCWVIPPCSQQTLA